MDYEKFQKMVSNQIKNLRKEKKLTQEEISGLEMSVRTYQKIENSENGLSLKSLFLLSQALEVHPKEIFQFDVPWDKKRKK